VNNATCLDCKHCEHWTEYGTDLHDCGLVTENARSVRRGTMTQQEHDMKWAVYFFAIDQSCEDEAASHCPQFEALEVHEHG